MELIINWCNDNNGFITAILSAIGLLLSVIAIVVSIRTARLGGADKNLYTYRALKGVNKCIHRNNESEP